MSTPEPANKNGSCKTIMYKIVKTANEIPKSIRGAEGTSGMPGAGGPPSEVGEGAVSQHQCPKPVLGGRC